MDCFNESFLNPLGAAQQRVGPLLLLVLERYALMPLSVRPHIDIDILPERRARTLGNPDCSVRLAGLRFEFVAVNLRRLTTHILFP